MKLQPGPGPSDRNFGFVHIGLNRHYPLVVDPDDVADTAAVVHRGQGRQRNHLAIGCGDHQLPEHIGYPTVCLGQLYGDVIIFIPFTERRDIKTVVCCFQCKPDHISGAEALKPVLVHFSLSPWASKKLPIFDERGSLTCWNGRKSGLIVFFNPISHNNP